jgi:hypothetical protein
MPIPMDIQHASEEFEGFLVDARDRSGLATRNQAYTMTQGVLQAFRRRLSLADAIRSPACCRRSSGRSLSLTGIRRSRKRPSAIARP